MPDLNLQGLVVEAMYASLDEPTKQRLIQSALGEMMKPPSGYGSKSPVEVAFAQAITDKVRLIAKECVEANDARIREIVNGVMTELAAQTLARKDFTVLFAEAFVSAIKNRS